MTEKKKAVQKAVIDGVNNVTESVARYRDGAQPKGELHDFDPQTRLLQRERKEPKKIQPRSRMRVKTGSPITEEDKKELAYLYEYVDGIFENNMVIGEGIVFSINLCKADDFCEWAIPANTPVSIPRGVARHLATRTWCRFKESPHEKDEFQNYVFEDHFELDRVEKRVDFKPLNVF